MYNRLFEYLTANEILYKKQFGFREGRSTEHAIIQLIDQIKSSFDKNHFTLGVFIDLSTAFGTVEKPNQYGVKGNNIRLFNSYLHNRKQYITFTNKCTAFENKTCSVPQGSILVPLFFLIYLNDLPNVSKLLDPIMFADDTNLFFLYHDIQTLFDTVNNELSKIRQWFIANRLSLNAKKLNIHFFIKNQLKIIYR